MQIELARQDFGSLLYGVPRLKTSNVYITDNPKSATGFSFVSRPILRTFATLSTDPLKGAYSSAGFLDGDIFAVSGQKLFRVSPNGSIVSQTSLPGESFCVFANSPERLLILRDGVAYFYDGTFIEPVTLPDNELVGDIGYINGYFIFTVKDSDKFYWTEPSEITILDLNFASAERSPDPIVAVKTLLDELWFIGTNNVEVWSATGDLAAPFQRINGRVYSSGCLSPYTVSYSSLNSLPCMLWVSEKNEVLLGQGKVTKISNSSVEELIRGYNKDIVAWSFTRNKNDFFIITTSQYTLVYDVNNELWHRWGSYGYDNWRAYLGVQAGSKIYGGDALSGVLWELDEKTTDGDEPFLVCEVSGYVPTSGAKVDCSVVEVFISVGNSLAYAFEPLLEMRWSDDGGNTWSTYMQTSLGDRGVYRTEVAYRSLGKIVKPGRVFEFRFTGFSNFRLDNATMNEGR